MEKRNEQDAILSDLLDQPFMELETPPASNVQTTKQTNQESRPTRMMERLSPEQQDKARQIANTITTDNQHSIMQYGVAAQSELSKFSDSVLQHIRTKDTSSVSKTIERLMDKIYEVKPEELEEKKGLLSRVFSPLKNRASDLMNKYDRLNVEIDTISDELDKHRQNLSKDVLMLENFYDRNKNYFLALNIYIAAGEERLDELQRVTYPELERQANATGDEMAIQKLKDLHDFMHRLEKRLHDLKLSRQIAIQTAPQIRLIQGTNQTLVEKIQSSVMNTIPLWKNQIVLAVAMNRQTKALEAQKQITKTTNELLLRNAEKLKMNTIEAARENERSMVDVDTLRKVQGDLIETLQETLKIQEEGRVSRQKAEVELHNMEEELKTMLLSMRKK